ncbi:MAG: YbaB/EbfC family nucleoid-associated protein [Bacteroidetes bacterium]|nr:MAG: YbaB/EbfC family nucleoid-associated protein [Bacteroidota bacterium]TAG87671.1 MAG: YbaB/EbfC family nucleoid-associated protein [Bacteroidota bacterium]
MMDMAKMMNQVQELQAKLEEAKDNLGSVKVSAEAGAGMVKTTVNGKKQVISLEIDEDLFRPEDKQMVQDLVIAAINKALNEVGTVAESELKKLTEQIIPNMPNIPGFDMNNLNK